MLGAPVCVYVYACVGGRDRLFRRCTRLLCVKDTSLRAEGRLPPCRAPIGARPCRHQSPSVLVPALRTVGNIVTGDDMQTQVCPLHGPPVRPVCAAAAASCARATPSRRALRRRALRPLPRAPGRARPAVAPSPLPPPLQIIINCGALPCLLNLLTTSHKKSIKKEACWTISNITAGTKEQIQVGACCGLVHTRAHAYCILRVRVQSWGASATQLPAGRLSSASH